MNLQEFVWIYKNLYEYILLCIYKNLFEFYFKLFDLFRIYTNLFRFYLNILRHARSLYARKLCVPTVISSLKYKVHVFKKGFKKGFTSAVLQN
jgi:hypothetical protein